MAALTLSEAQKLDQNDLQAGVIESLVTRSMVLERLPFAGFTGDNFEFNRENKRPASAWADPDEVLGTDGATFTNVTVAMRYLYQQVDVPTPLRLGLSSLVDQVAVQMNEASLAMRDDFLDAFWYGDNSTNSKHPDGLHYLIDNITVPTGASRPRVNEGASSAAGTLNLTSVDNMLYSLMKRGVDLMAMHSTIFRLFQAASRTTSVSGTVNFVPNDMGAYIPTYAGIPLSIDDSIRITETVSTAAYGVATGGSATTIFFLKFGEDFLHGLQQTSGPTVEGPFPLPDKDTWRMRLKWYVVPAVLRSLYSAGKIDGIDDATAIAA